MTQQLLDILSSSDHEQLKNYISSLVDTANISEFQKAFEHFISEAILPNVTKDAVISTFEKLKSIDDCVKLDFMMSLMPYCQMYPTFLQIVEKNKAEYIKLCTENKMLEELAEFYVNEPISVTLFKIVIFVSDEHPEKENPPILVILFGIVIFVSELHPKKT